MFTFRIGHTTVHLWPFIIVLFITILGFLLVFVLCIVEAKKSLLFVAKANMKNRFLLRQNNSIIINVYSRRIYWANRGKEMQIQ